MEDDPQRKDGREEDPSMSENRDFASDESDDDDDGTVTTNNLRSSSIVASSSWMIDDSSVDEEDGDDEDISVVIRRGVDQLQGKQQQLLVDDSLDQTGARRDSYNIPKTLIVSSDGRRRSSSCNISLGTSTIATTPSANMQQDGQTKNKRKEKSKKKSKNSKMSKDPLSYRSRSETYTARDHSRSTSRRRKSHDDNDDTSVGSVYTHTSSVSTRYAASRGRSSHRRRHTRDARSRSLSTTRRDEEMRQDRRRGSASSVTSSTTITDWSLSKTKHLHTLVETCDYAKLQRRLEQLQVNGTREDVCWALHQRNSLGQNLLQALFSRVKIDTKEHTGTGTANCPPLSLLDTVLEVIPDDDLYHFLRQSVDRRGNTPLHLACAHWHFASVELLYHLTDLSGASCLLQPNQDGNTPLHLIISSPAFYQCLAFDFDLEYTAKKTLEWLLQRAAEAEAERQPLQRTNEGETGVGTPAMESKENERNRKIRCQRAVMSRPNHKGQTLLHLALRYGAHELVIRKLLELDAQTAGNNPPSSFDDSIPLVRLSDHQGWLPLHYIAAGTLVTAAALKHRSSEVRRPYHPYTLVETLLQRYTAALTTASRTKGDTPLHVLVQNVRKRVNNSQPNSSNEKADGETSASRVFVPRNVCKIAELLLFGLGGPNFEQSRSVQDPPTRRHCPILIQNVQGMTPLHLVAKHDAPLEITELLLASSAAMTALHTKTFDQGWTPLHVACASSRIANESFQASFQALLTACPDACMTPDDQCHIPLMVAVQNKKLVDKFLLNLLIRTSPSSIRQTLESGHSVLHLAVQSHKAQKSIVKALVKACPDAASSTATTADGNTVLHEACMYNAPLNTIALLVQVNGDAVLQRNHDCELPMEVAQLHDASRKIIHFLDKRHVKGKGEIAEDCSRNFGYF